PSPSSRYSLYCSVPPSLPPPFPTRRSSDLPSDAFSLKSVLPFLVVPPVAIAAGVPVVVLSIFAAGLGPSVWSVAAIYAGFIFLRSEEHTSELQSRFDLVCRLLLEKKKKIII